MDHPVCILLSRHLSFLLSAHLFILLFISISMHLIISLSNYHTICPSICMYYYLSIHLSIYLSVFLSIYSTLHCLILTCILLTTYPPAYLHSKCLLLNSCNNYLSNWRGCCYTLLALLFGPCCAFFTAINFACLAFQVILVGFILLLVKILLFLYFIYGIKSSNCNIGFLRT